MPAKKKMVRPNFLKQLRNAMKLTQGEVAKLLDIDITTVNMHENGLRGLTEDMVAKYSKLYKVPSHRIFLQTLQAE